ncbi:unnamed protein product, partial [Ascophyllum nodosum]
MPRNVTRVKANAGDRKKKGKRRNKGHAKEETAPHILAALEAQRARSAAQQRVQSAPQPTQTDHGKDTTPPSHLPPSTATQQPAPGALPGFVFDPTRNRYFRAVKNPLGNPAERRGAKRKMMPIVLNVQDRDNPHGDGSCGGPLDSSVDVRPQSDATAAALSLRKLRDAGTTTRGRGLHSYAMARRRGFWGRCGALASPGVSALKALAVAGPPAPPERSRRLAVESIVSSSRFCARPCDAWMGRGACSAIDWDPASGVVVVGTSSGEIGIRQATPDPWSGDSFEDSFTHGGSLRVDEGIVQWASDPSRSEVSDVKLQSFGDRWAVATAFLGREGEAGGVSATVVPYGGGDRGWPWVNTALRDPHARVTRKQVRHGSVWCVDWDPSTPGRLAFGPSACCPVSLFDVESAVLTPVARLTSDVFSICFLPLGAPGGGDVMVCGLRDGSVRLVDTRQPPRANPAAEAAAATASTTKLCTAACIDIAHRNNRHRGARAPASPSMVGKIISVKLDSSVDHTHVLRDGTRCLVRHRFGGLHVVDLRFTGRPLRALVEPPAAVKLVPVRRKFALDDRETVVVMPIAATAAVRGRDTLPSSTRSDGRAELGTGAEMGSVGRFSSTPLPWDTFLSGVGDRVDANGAIRGADGLNGVRS